MYRHLLNQPFEGVEIVKAAPVRKTPTVFSHDKACRVIHYLSGSYKIMAQIMYGAGLRISEVLRLRVKDIDFSQKVIAVMFGKNNRHRRTILPDSLIDRCAIKYRRRDLFILKISLMAMALCIYLMHSPGNIQMLLLKLHGSLFSRLQTLRKTLGLESTGDIMCTTVPFKSK